MKGAIEFLLQNYTTYMFIIPFCLASYTVYALRRQTKEQGISEKAYYILGILIAANLMSWIMMNHDFKLYVLFPEEISVKKYLVKLIAILAIAVFIPYILKLVHKIYKCVSRTDFFIKQRFTIAIFVFSMMQFFGIFPSRMNGWGGIWFALDYSMGFGPRMMPGSILRLFYNDYLDPQWVYHVAVGIEVFIIAFVSVLLGNYVRRSFELDDKNLKIGSIVLVLFFIASPGWISATWKEFNFARFENYTMIVSFTGIVLFSKIRNVYLRYIVITVLSVFSMSIYHGDLFLYYPLFLMVMIYDIFEESNTINKKRLLLSGISCATTLIGFSVFQFVNTIRYKTYDDLMNAIHEKTYFEDGGSLYYELFADLKTAYHELQLPFLTGEEMPREKAFLTIIVVLPLIVLFLCIYLKCLSLLKEQGRSIFSGSYIYISLLGLATIPQFALNTDWGRWMIAITIVYFISIMYMCYKGDPIVCSSVSALGENAQNHSFLVGIMILWLAGLEKFDPRDFISQVNKMYSLIP